MNMPLTVSQIAHADTVRELSNADRRAMDAIAADIQAVQPPAIDAAACDVASVNETETERQMRAWPADEWMNARAFVRGYFGREPTNTETEMYLQGSKVKFAGNRSDSYKPVEQEDPEPFDEFTGPCPVAGNRLDTLGHKAMMAKNMPDVSVGEAAARSFMVLAGVIVIVAVVYFSFKRWG